MLFKDRRDAGRLLGAALRGTIGAGPLLVLALPRGGVPVGYEVARSLGAALDVFIVRKLGAPGMEELAMGALAEDGTRLLNESVVLELGIADKVVQAATERERKELQRRIQLYRGSRPAPDVSAKTVILVDDGMATGMSMKAAVLALRRQAPRELIVAVPVGAAQTCAELSRQADRLVCLVTPEPFGGVGSWYEDFSQTSDEEVLALLKAGSTPS